MTEFEKTQKYYNGRLTLLKPIGEQYEQEEILLKEERVIKRDLFNDDEIDPSDGMDFTILDNVNTLKNLIAFAEVTRYKNTLLVDMEKEERDEVINKIIQNLSQFEVKPVAYEIKQESIVIAWYLNSVINTFTFSNESTAFVD